MTDIVRKIHLSRSNAYYRHENALADLEDIFSKEISEKCNKQVSFQSHFIEKD